MFRSRYSTLHDLSAEELLVVSEHACHKSVAAIPIYECVKVFARLASDSTLSYARHHTDLGTDKTTAIDIVQRFRNKDRTSVVLEALTAVESSLIPAWPFAPGSSSWVQLEILDPSIRFSGPVNSSAIVVRRAVRLNRAKKKISISTTPLIESMFNRMERDLPETAGAFSVLFAPQLKLKNLAGTGLISESASDLGNGLSTIDIAERIVLKILSENSSVDPSINPGFYISVLGEEYRIVSSEYSTSIDTATMNNTVTNLPPLPIGVFR
jgi:hypothetical protein